MSTENGGGGGGQLPFSPISDDDHAGYIWIVTILGFIYSSMAVAVRGQIKWRMYGADDYLLAAAMFIHIGQSIAVFYGLNHGLGKFNSITAEPQWLLSGRSFLISEILSIIILCLGKCSVIALILRIFTTSVLKSWLVCFALLVLSVLWGIGSIIALVVITAFDATTEVLICLLPVMMTWSLNMPLKQKVYVVVAFSFRILIIIAMGHHLACFEGFPSHAEPQFALTNTLLFQQVMVTWSLLSSTIPTMRGFMRSFTTEMSSPKGRDTTNRSKAKCSHVSHPSVDSHSFQSITSKPVANNTTQAMDIQVGGGFTNVADSSKLVLRPDITEHSITISHPERARDSIGYRGVRNGSHDIIIKKEVQWDVQHEIR